MQKIKSNNLVRLALLLIGYTIALLSAIALAYDLRFDFTVPVEYQATRNLLAPFVILVQLVALALYRQFGSLLTYFSVPDLLRIVGALSTSSAVLSATWYLSGGRFAPPRGVIMADFVFAVAGMSCLRLGLRMYRERFAGILDHGVKAYQVKRIAIVGAGDVGARLVQEAASRPKLGLRPICFLDDDVTKHGRQLHGVTVQGRPEAIAQLAADGQIDAVVIAMPSAAGRRVREIVQQATEAKLRVEIVPSMSELASGRVQVSKIRPVDVEDLLGRAQIDLDSAGIRKCIEDRVVLVTGAGGSIGSELCRQIAVQAPKRLLMVEQAEGSLFVIEQELNELGVGTLAVPLVGDILDAERMEYVFSHYRPDVVFHAAAHKHVYLMERQPAEAIRNNVLGTRVLAEMASRYCVDRFVLISTDKAINPTSVMGATKRLAELQILAMAESQPAQAPAPERPPVHGQKDIQVPAGAGRTFLTYRGISRSDGGPDFPMPNSPAESGGAAAAPFRVDPARETSLRLTKFMSVRFGNVLGSSGSVVPIFKRQIANGGPVTVTHPEVMRYFMTIPEAVGLVLQAGIIGQGGEIFVLDMGQPIKIVDLARQMIELSGLKVGDDIEIKFTGLKPGEKLYEELRHTAEHYSPGSHPRIMRFVANTRFEDRGFRELSQRLYDFEPAELKALLKRYVPEYTPFTE